MNTLCLSAWLLLSLIVGICQAHSIMVCMDVNVAKASSPIPTERCNAMARAFNTSNHGPNGAGGEENFGWNAWQGALTWNREYSPALRNGCDSRGGLYYQTTPGQNGCVDWTENYKCSGCHYGVFRPGDTFRPMHYARTHAHSTGGMVKIFIMKFDQNIAENISFALDYSTPVCSYPFNSSCWQINLATTPCYPTTPCMIPTNTPAGNYTMVWRWYWHLESPASNDYVAAADFVVLPQGSNTPAPTAPPTTKPTPTPTATPPPSPTPKPTSPSTPKPTPAATPKPTSTPTPKPTPAPTTAPNTPKPTSSPCTPSSSTPPGTGLTGSFYSNTNFTTLFGTQVSPTIDFDYVWGGPLPGMYGNFFSVRWQGKIQAPYSATYTFYTLSDDTALLKVNGVIVVSDTAPHGPHEASGSISLVAGQKYSIELLFQEFDGSAVIRMYWSSACHQKQIVPQAQLYPN